MQTKQSQCSSKHNMLKKDWPTSSQQDSNNTSKTDLAPVLLEPQSPMEYQKSFSNPTQNQLLFPETKTPEHSLPHLYESVRGQKLWLTSPKGSDLNILEEKEERGAAAAHPHDNSAGNAHAYAILEPEEGVRCKFADTADSLPSLLAPSSLDHEGSADESAVSSAEAVLNFDTKAPPLPPKWEAEEPRGGEGKKAQKKSFTRNFTEGSLYDSLEPKVTGPMHKQLSLQEETMTLSLKPTFKKTKSHGPAPLLKRLYSQ